MSDDTDQPDGEATTYGLIYAFPDPSHSFVHGYEAGFLAHRMHSGEKEIDNGLPFHTANVELFGRMARHYGYEMETSAVTCDGHPPGTFDIYTTVKFTKIENKRPPKPSLRVVGGDAA